MLSGRLTRIVVRINLVPVAKSCTAITLMIRTLSALSALANGLWEEKDVS
jgi:hypothetical protein